MDKYPSGPQRYTYSGSRRHSDSAYRSDPYHRSQTRYTPSNGPRRPRKKKRRITPRALLFLLFFVVFCVSAVMLISSLVRYYQSRRAYDEISELVVSTVQTDSAPLSEESVFAEPDDEMPAATPGLISGALPWEREEKIAEEIGITVDWDALKDINRYVVAWLYCPGTNINYPVVKYKDNEYFLNRNFNRREDSAGTLFFDYRNILSEGSENWVIYGHRRNDKSMFGSLAKYSKEDYLAEHPVMYLLMPDRCYRAEIFCCRTVHAEQKYFQLWFGSREEYSEYLDRAIRQCYWTPTITPDPSGPILTLSTCSTYSGDNEPRLLVHAKLVPMD